MLRPPAHNSRIDLLDSFRFLAIFSVILYHYYCRWAPPHAATSLYPYGNTYSYFNYGHLGVQFFFIISGFVIAYTLQGTARWTEFWKKRLIRLVPAMVLCSLITMLVLAIADRNKIFPNGHSITNLLYSISFIQPELLDKIFSGAGIHGTHINGSYWSLWPEIQFYLVASILYYMKPRYFTEIFSVFAFALFGVNLLLLNVQHGNALHLQLPAWLLQGYNVWGVTIFNLTIYVMYFLLGILFYQMYNGRKDLFIRLVFPAAVLFQFAACSDWTTRIIFAAMIVLFLLFVYFPVALKPLSGKIFVKTGAVSYSLYLLHEVTGVLLIHLFAGAFGSVDFLFPMLVAALVTGISMLMFRYFESPVSKYLRKQFL